MMSFAVLVRFKIHEQDLDSFLPLMRKQAADSLVLEPECSVFDVWLDANEPATVHLYEIYENAEAFQKHLETEHFKKFDKAVQQMVDKKDVTTCNQRLDAGQ